jgi:dTDP-4-amino-4,6-dideoxy-D-galactose acyltransferase
VTAAPPAPRDTRDQRDPLNDAPAVPSPAPPCELLDWDSRHFGKRIARVPGDVLTPAALAAAVAWADRNGVDCLYWLAGSGDPAMPAVAAGAGFQLVDIRVTLERRLDRRLGPGKHPAQPPAVPQAPQVPATQPDPPVRAATAADLPRLLRLAAASHHDSRFYSDPHFARERCDALYAAWIERCCADPEGLVLVADDLPPAPAAQAGAGGPAGYITVALQGTPDGQGHRGGQIGLFAVAAAAQGRGLGGRLIDAALAWLHQQGATTVSVVTQGRNVRAQRLYQRSGMLTRSVELWYHRWRQPAAAAAGTR